ncbi:MAG: EpsG family protein [Firmicutes bacterium]|nr:EpsG family protein [Bacillota bacterium]
MNSVLFLLFLALSVFLFFFADKKDDKKILIIAILIISLLAGLRGENVGVDTSAYMDAFVNQFPKSWQFEEFGFRFVSNLLMKMFNNASVVMLIYALLTNFLIFLRLWDFRKKSSFGLMGLLYILIYFLSSMNIMRQFIAVAIVLYSTKLLENKKYVLFFIIVLLTSLIHKTSLLSVAFIFVYCWSDLSPRKKIVFGPIMFVFITIGLSYVIKYESDHIANYLSVSNEVKNFNLTFIYRVMAFFISWIIYKKNIVITFGKYSKITNFSKNKNDKKEFNKISFIYFLGIIFASIGMFFDNMSRVGLYYLSFEIIYWGYIIKNSNNKVINIFLILLYASYVFIFEIIYNGSMIFPYYAMFGGA